MNDEHFMQLALAQAELAAAQGEVPVGAVVVHQGQVVAQAHNAPIGLNDPTAHAEVLALRAAAQRLGNYRLEDCTLYVTLEPCLMCAGAIYWSQLGRLVYGASEEKRGFEKLGTGILHPKTEIVSGVLANESEQLLKEFFSMRR
mgnify:CR=1 FL=1